MSSPDVDYGDVQGLLRFAHGKMAEASFALLRVNDVEAARAWLRSAPVTSALTTNPPPTSALQVAFTAAGLRALGVPATTLAGFSAEFLAGLTEDSRSRRLGDVGRSAPSQWEWGSPANVPHLVAMFYAEAGRLEPFQQAHIGDAWKSGFELLRWLHTGNLDGAEPFGFVDGISQPQIDWPQQRQVSAGRFDYSNVVALGEFLLGYRNEYEKYTDRPLLDADASTATLLPAQDAPEKRDLGRNGSYLVLRQLRQDVRSFWQFVRGQAGGDPAEADKLAAAFVGRTRAGDPLVPVRGPGQNQFTFDEDPAGVRCPVGAHVRRANPRNTDYPGHASGFGRLLADLGFRWKGFQDDLTSSVRFHRVLRRGREYGPGLSPAEALEPTPPGDPERGLHFVCLNANIARQFEFLQNAWMTSTKFAGLTEENDPLVGSREANVNGRLTDNFTAPVDGAPARCVQGVPQFVTVRGGAYFFLPSLRALRYFTGA